MSKIKSPIRFNELDKDDEIQGVIHACNEPSAMHSNYTRKHVDSNVKVVPERCMTLQMLFFTICHREK